MNISYTTKFIGNLTELRKPTSSLMHHAEFMCCVIRSAFTGAFDDEPDGYDKMEEDIHIVVELNNTVMADDWKVISVASHWYYKNFHGQIEYTYNVFADDTDETRSTEALLVTYDSEYNTQVMINPLTITIYPDGMLTANLFTASIHEVTLRYFDGIRAW